MSGKVKPLRPVQLGGHAEQEPAGRLNTESLIKEEWSRMEAAAAGVGVCWLSQNLHPMPRTVLRAEDKTVNRTDNFPSPLRSHNAGETDSKE